MNHHTKNTAAKRGGLPCGYTEVRPARGVSAADTFNKIATAITAAGSVALDIETFGSGKKGGLNPWRGDIRLLSLRVVGASPWLIDLQATGYDLGDLGRAIEAVEVIAHNAKFDLLWLAVKCAVHPKKVFCTLTAARLLSAGTKPGNNLDQCLERFLGIAPAPDQSRSDWGGMFLTDDQLAYAARDVAHLHDLAGRLDTELGGADLETVTYGALRQWHGESHNIAERGVGEVRTVLGRRRLIPKEADAWQQFTALVNTPVQGGCADGMKRALVLIASRLPANSRLISTVHDEVIVESPEADAEAVCAVVRESMISAMTELFPQVPIEVEAGVCERWSEK